MSGPNNWNRQQGFYIYRANRLIQSGGWSHMRTADEHTKLSRVALMFSPELDAAFGINVAKMRVALPPELVDLIEDPVNREVKRARSVYDAKPDQAKPRRSAAGGGAAAADRGSGGAANGRGVREDVSGDERGGATAVTGEVARTRRKALETAARAAGERDALERIIDQLGQSAPEVARDLGF